MTEIFQTTPQRPTTITSNHNTQHANNSSDSIITTNTSSTGGPGGTAAFTQQTFTTASSPSQLIDPNYTTTTSSSTGAAAALKKNKSSPSLTENSTARAISAINTIHPPPSLQSSPVVKPTDGLPMVPSASSTLAIQDQRPPSRSSMTSCLSTTATKDGIEGKRIKKRGISGYPLRLINKMYENHHPGFKGLQLQSFENTSRDYIGAGSGVTNGPYGGYDKNFIGGFESEGESLGHNHEELGIDDNDDVSLCSVKSLSSMIPQYSKEDLVMSGGTSMRSENMEVDGMA